VDEAGRLDCSIYDVTVRLADGIHGGPAVRVTRPLLGGGTLSFAGDDAVPANVVVPGFAIKAATVGISGVKFASATDYINSIDVKNGAAVTTGAIEFGAIGANAYHISVVGFGNVTLGADYRISGGALRHWRASGGGLITATSRTVTLTGTPAFTDFAYATECGVIDLWNPAFIGAATGRRYNINANAAINTFGKPESTLPGNVAGAVSNGGVYV
jgi:hypothetical protein